MDEAEPATPLRDRGAGVALDPPAPGSGRWTDLRDPPGRLFHSVLGVILVWLLWAVSAPAPDVLGVLVGLVALTAVGLVWLVRGAWLLRQRRDRPSVPWRPFAFAPGVVGLTLTLMLLDAPLQARWEISRPDFERMAKRMARPASGSSSDPFWERSSDGRRLGLYDISGVTGIGDGVIFSDERRSELFGYAGFAYLPNGPSSMHSATTYEHLRLEGLGGGWYRWTAS